jgi:hypothetical protein
MDLARLNNDSAVRAERSNLALAVADVKNLDNAVKLKAL